MLVNKMVQVVESKNK